MYAEERHQAILVRAREVGSVDVDVLSAAFDVSMETIRRDLKVLERAGLVRRVHGGAIAVERLDLEPSLATRDQLMIQEKEAIAQRAISELPPSGAILLDAGSTTQRVAAVLPVGTPYTVVTNSPSIAMGLAPREDLTVFMLGGRVRGQTIAAVDDWALRSIGQLTIDVAFVATNGVTVSGGLTTPDLAEAAIKRAMIASARRVVLVADHTKVGVDCFARFGSLADVDLFVTDFRLADKAYLQLHEAGLSVVRAAPLHH